MGYQGTNTLGHLLWLPLRGRAGTRVRAEGSKPLKAWKTQGDGETEGPRRAAGATHSKGWGEGGGGAGRMSTEHRGAWDGERGGGEGAYMATLGSCSQGAGLHSSWI